MAKKNTNYDETATRNALKKIWRKLPTWARILILVLCVGVFIYTRVQEMREEERLYQEQLAQQEAQQSAGQEDVSESSGSVKGELSIHYVDVGQADCTILVSEGEALLIDAGNNNDEELVVEYLQGLDVDRLVYAIGTHSHEDHVGGLDSVIEHCDPEYVMLPEEDTTTKTYRDVLTAIEEQEVELLRPMIGDVYEFGEASFQILGPVPGEKESPNGYSIFVLVTFGENRFLFTGDAEAAEEEEVLALGMSLECDVFQAGHHGSSTSNTREFLKAADPIYTVISCGVDNDYGHPHAEVVAEFEEQDIQMYRTDLMGTIVVTSDGKNIRFRTAK